MRHFRLATIISILLFCNNIYSLNRYTPQQYAKYEIKTGFGLEQGLNVGFNRYYSKNFNFGFGIGSHFPPKEYAHHIVLNAENNFHFVLTRSLKTEPSILFNQQVMFWRYSEPDFTHHAVTFALNTGVRFTSPSGFGYIFEFGPTITYTLKLDKVPGSTIHPITNEIQPNFRFLVFQRF